MGKGMKIAGLVLGIVSLVLCWIPFATFFGLPMAIIGLVLAIVGNKKEKTGLGTAAFVICLIAVILAGIGFVTCGLCVACVGAAAGGLL